MIIIIIFGIPSCIIVKLEWNFLDIKKTDFTGRD